MEQSNSGKVKILIVDDVESNRFALRDIVRNMGYQPILAENGEQALRVVDKFDISLILSDVAMPVMDGYEFCRRVKSNPEKRNIPVIFISAFDNPKDIVMGFENHGEDYITKPFIPEVVKVRIDAHIKVSEATKDMRGINELLQTSLSKQQNQVEHEKQNVLYAIIRIVRACHWYDNNKMVILGENCRTFAEALQLTNEFSDKISDRHIDLIELTCVLKNIGYLSLPDDIIENGRNGDLVKRKEYEKYPAYGADILKDIKKGSEYNDAIDMAIEIAGYHTENYDGSGYPNGLKADEIPLSAQLVAIVSHYCELTQDEGMSKEEAINDIAKNSGKLFNPVMADVFCRIGKQMK